MDDERRFSDLLVRRDDKALNDAGVDAAGDRDDGVERGGGGDRPQPADPERLPDRQRGAEYRGTDERPQRRHAGVHIGVGRAGDHP